MHTPLDEDAPGANSFLIIFAARTHFDAFFDKLEKDGFFHAVQQYREERQLGKNPINWM